MSNFKAKIHKIWFPLGLRPFQTPLGELTAEGKGGGTKRRRLNRPSIQSSLLCLAYRRPCSVHNGCVEKVSPRRRDRHMDLHSWQKYLLTSNVWRLKHTSESATCVLQRTNTRFGDRAFRVAGPSVWNSLAADLRHPDLSLGQFRRAIKTFLINRFCSA